MKRKEITDRIEKFTKIAESTDGNSHNLAMNILSVLEYMLKKFDNPDSVNGRGDYDEETDYYTAYRNAIQELSEANKNESRTKKTD